MRLKTLLSMMVLAMAFAPLAMADDVPMTAPANVMDLDAMSVGTTDPAANEVVSESPATVEVEVEADDNRIPAFQALPEITWVQGPVPCSDDCGGGGGGSGGGGSGYTCSVTITCAGTPFSGPYSLTCQGRNSCSKYPNNSNPTAVVCDGIGTCCFPGPC